ncbi:MAG: glycosyltransferase [Bacteroidota bacterium]
MKKVLVASLNWGLGHATRDIPVIRELQRQGAEVLIASDGAALELLRKEFPGLKCFELPAWNITYPATGNLSWHLLRQLPKVIRAIRNEHRVLENLVTRENIDLVVSDSRMGCYSSTVKSVVLTHQLFIETPFLRKLVNRNNHRMLRKFSEVWIPDVPGENNLAGRLSWRKQIPFKHRYLGILSRFHTSPQHSETDVVAVISGPEPQRTAFENELLPKLEQSGLNCAVLLGKPGMGCEPVVSDKLTIYPHLPADEAEQLFRKAGTIISRSGYSTVMDLAVLGKKAILVPTPGQPEQEYLAEYCREKGWFVIEKQGEINLEQAFEQIGRSGVPGFTDNSLLEDAVMSFLF